MRVFLDIFLVEILEKRGFWIYSYRIYERELEKYCHRSTLARVIVMIIVIVMRIWGCGSGSMNALHK